LRAVTSTDSMTADFYPFDMNFLGTVATGIVNEVKGRALEELGLTAPCFFSRSLRRRFGLSDPYDYGIAASGVSAPRNWTRALRRPHGPVPRGLGNDGGLFEA
jgi:hypothetical protein